MLNENILGLGTMIMATKKKFIPIQFVIGLIQLIAFWTVIAYLWSVLWGVLIYLEGRKG